MIHDVAGLFDEAVIAPPSDRRMTQRLLNLWAATAHGAFPSWTDLRAADLGDDWNWVFVVDLKLSVGFPYFIYLGSKLARLSDVYLSGASDWTLSLLDKATANVDAAVAAAAPHFHDDSLMLCDGRQIQFRCMTAPLADDGESVSHVFGCAHGRFAPASGQSLRAV